VLSEVADGTAGLVDHWAFARLVEGHGTSPSTPASRGSTSCPRRPPAGPGAPPRRAPPGATLPAEDAAAVRRDWDAVVTEAGNALVFRD